MFYIADLVIKIWLTFTAIAELNFALSCRFMQFCNCYSDEDQNARLGNEVRNWKIALGLEG